MELREKVARAIHEHLSRRNIMQYLDNEEDCEGLAQAAIDTVFAHLREVTPEMLNAAMVHTNTWFSQDESDHEILSGIYLDMLDAAQKGE